MDLESWNDVCRKLAWKFRPEQPESMASNSAANVIFVISALDPMKVPPQIAHVRKSEEHLRNLAQRAVCTGSQEHKERRSWLGLPRLRSGNEEEEYGYKQNATPCPLVSENERTIATSWVKAAIVNRQYSPLIWDGDFPREIWYRDNLGQYWFGRLMQRGTDENSEAEYNGWPVSQEEWHENFG